MPARERRVLPEARFGRLRIVTILTTKQVFAECDCGTQKLYWRANLIRSKSPTRSCGCMRREQRHTYARRHGHYRSRTYRSWYSMKTRCANPANNNYVNYGARGITVCDEWQDFPAFLADMGVRPSGMSLDRIDVNGNYEPHNCRWATAYQQAQNKRPRAHKVRVIRADDGGTGA